MSEKCKHSVCRSRGLLRCYTCGKLLHDEATLREKLAAAEAERDRLGSTYGATLAMMRQQRDEADAREETLRARVAALEEGIGWVRRWAAGPNGCENPEIIADLDALLAQEPRDG